MTRLDWERDRRNQLPKDISFDPKSKKRKKKGRPKSKDPILREIVSKTKTLKARLKIGSPSELSFATNELRRLVLSHVCKTGRATTAIQNARTVIARVTETLQRQPTRQSEGSEK